MSPSLYLIVVPLIRRNGQPMFSWRSRCTTLTLHARMAAYTCSSTHAHGTAGTWVKSIGRGTALTSSGWRRFRMVVSVRHPQRSPPSGRRAVRWASGYYIRRMWPKCPERANSRSWQVRQGMIPSRPGSGRARRRSTTTLTWPTWLRQAGFKPRMSSTSSFCFRRTRRPHSSKIKHFHSALLFGSMNQERPGYPWMGGSGQIGRTNSAAASLARTAEFVCQANTARNSGFGPAEAAIRTTTPI